MWTRYKTVFTAQIEEARRTGTPEPVLYPHPDDIVIDSRSGPRFLGPWDEKEEQDIRHTVRTCEVLLMQDELDHRSDKRLDGSPVKEPGTALFMFNALNETLPPRFKLADSVIHRLRWQYRLLSKRALLKDLFAGWRSIGKPRPRGFISPDMTKVVPRFVAHHEFAIDVARRKVDITAMSLDETTELILDRLEERVPVLEQKLRAAMEQARSR